MATIPEFTIVEVLIPGFAATSGSVSNAAVNNAIDDNAAATRAALGLGTAALSAATAFETAGAAAAAQASAISTAAADATAKANAAQAAAISTASTDATTKANAAQAAAIAAAATDATTKANAAQAAAIAASQPLDSDLTAIAALATTAYGRALLELADAAAGRTAFSAAPTTVTQGKHAVPIMAGAIRPSVTGGCAAVAAVAIAANQPDINTLNFDASTEEYAQFAIPMPKSWNEGTVTAQFRWSHAATTTNFGVVWGIQAVAVSDDDTMAAAFGTPQTVTDTGGTTNDLYITSETPEITIAGTPQAGDTVYFRVYRKSADASDTMAIDARLHSVVLFLTTDADTDA